VYFETERSYLQFLSCKAFLILNHLDAKPECKNNKRFDHAAQNSDEGRENK